MNLNISTEAWGFPFHVLAQIYVVLVVFSPYKMAPQISVQQRSLFFLKFICKPVVTWKPRGNYHNVSMSTYSYQKQEEIKYNMEKFHNMVLAETGIRRLVVPKDGANIAAAPWTLGQNPIQLLSLDTAPDTLCALILSRRRKSKQGFYWFSCRDTAQRRMTSWEYYQNTK